MGIVAELDRDSGLRVVHVIPAFAPAWSYGGPVRAVADLVRSLASRGHDVAVLTTSAMLPAGHPALRARHQVENWHGAEVHRFALPLREFSGRHRLFFSPALRSYFATSTRSVDLVHIHEYWTLMSVDAVRWASSLGAPIALSAHGSLARLGHRRVPRALFERLHGETFRRHVNFWVSVSPLETRQYAEAGITSNKIIELPNGVDEGLASLEANEPRRREVLYLGRVHIDKGIDTLIRAFSKIIGSMPDARLRVIGPDDGAMSWLRRLSDGLGIRESVDFEGLTSGERKARALQRAKVVAYLSRYEVFGLVPFEGLLSGTPAVVTSNTGCGELLKEYQNVHLVPYGDVDATAQALLRVLQADRHEASIESDRRRVLAEYGVNRRAQEYERFVYRALAASRA